MSTSAPGADSPGIAALEVAVWRVFTLPVAYSVNSGTRCPAVQFSATFAEAVELEPASLGANFPATFAEAVELEPASLGATSPANAPRLTTALPELATAGLALAADDADASIDVVDASEQAIPCSTARTVRAANSAAPRPGVAARRPKPRH